MNLRTDVRWCLRRLPVWVLATAFALGLLLWGRPASAQLTAGTVVPRPYSHEGHPFWISKSDCDATDDILGFTFTVPSSAVSGNYLFEVWASESVTCLLDAERHSVSNPKCKQIANLGAVKKTTIDAPIRSSDIANTLDGVENCVDSGSQTGTRKVNVSFLLLAKTTEDVPAANAVTYPSGTIDIAVDLLGPDPPSTVTASSSEAALAVDLTGSTPSQDTLGYYIYCDPPPTEDASTNGGCDCVNAGAGTATGGASVTTTTTTTTTSATMPPPPNGGGGAGGDLPQPAPGGAGGAAAGAGGAGGAAAGAGGGTSSGSATCTTSNISDDVCVSCILKPGQDPPTDAYLCGRISGTSTSGTAAILTNDRAYAVGVAAYDSLGNVGKLSPIDCDTPQAVSDFFETYREAGGKGGGGCAVSPRFRTTSTLAPLGAAIAAITFALRRRKRSRAARTGDRS